MSGNINKRSVRGLPCDRGAIFRALRRRHADDRRHSASGWRWEDEREERRQTEGYGTRLQTGTQEKKKEIYKWHTEPSVKAELPQFVKVEGVSKIHR